MSGGAAAVGSPVRGTASSGMDKELMNAMKGVGQAIKLDTSGKTREAYLRYLSCIQFISQVLLEDARQKASTGSAMQSTTANKMLKLVQQCTERSTALFPTIDESQTVVIFPQAISPIPSTTTTLPITQHQTPTAMVTAPSLSHPSTVSATTHHANALHPYPPATTSPGGVTPDNSDVVSSIPHVSLASQSYAFPPVPSMSPVRVSPGATSPRGMHPVTALSPKATARSSTATANSIVKGSPARKNQQASPLDIAYRENKKLMAAYRARLARMESKKNRAAMSLTLQRRLIENMAIAKAREAALAKKIHERQQRLQEEAVRRFSSGGEPTVQELELRHVYASSMEFENHVNWLQDWRLKLEESPHNLQLIHELITMILNCKEHPLSQQLQRYQYAVYKLIYPLIHKGIEGIYRNRVPFHDVDPLKLSAGAESRIIPNDGFMTPDDPSNALNEDLLKRLYALRESVGPHVTRLPVPDCVDDEDFEDLLSDDALVDDVITEGREDEDADQRELEGQERTIQDTLVEDGVKQADVKEADCTSSDDNVVSERDLTSPEVGMSIEESTRNSTQVTCQEDDDIELRDDKGDVENDNGDVENDNCDVRHDVEDVVNAMKDELEEAIGDGEELKQRLEKQITKDKDIGHGRVKPNNDGSLAVDSGDEDVDRRSSADSGVQEDRTDGDESSGTHSATSPVIEDGQTDLQMPCTLQSETESEIDQSDYNIVSQTPESVLQSDGAVGRTACEESCSDLEDTNNNGVLSQRSDSDQDHTSEDGNPSDAASSEDVVRTDAVSEERTDCEDGNTFEDEHDLVETNDEISSERTDTNDATSSERTDGLDGSTNECSDVVTLDQNANEDDDVVTKTNGDNDAVSMELSETPEVKGRTRDFELSDKELEGEIDGALDETEEERIVRLKEEALARHLKTISSDVLSYMDKLLSMLVAIYDDLDSTIAKEQCIAVIEDHFFKVIWQPLSTLFRRVGMSKETTAAIAMTKYQYAAPEHIGVVKKLCLTQQEGSVQNSGGDNYPYWQAVQELRKVTQYYTPLDKLECIVRSSRMIIQCVGDYHESLGEPRNSSESAVGCDDLLPILSYVIIKSAIPQIVSECSTMEEFIHEGYLFGEEGYCLTTLQTALGYVLKLAND